MDSSGCLECFANGPNAEFFAPAIEGTAQLAVPPTSVYEVFKRILQQRDEGNTLQAVAVMQQGVPTDFDLFLTLAAARLSLRH